MLAYLVRRILGTVPIVLGVALLTFVLFHVAGGDPILQLLGPHASPQEWERLRDEYGLNQPLWQQFVSYLWQMLTFQFERSFYTKQTIGTMLADGASASLSLALPAFAITLGVSISIALLAAFFRNTWLDRSVVVLSVLGMSVSVLAFILFGQYFLAYTWGAFPISGYESGWLERWEYLALPIVIWVLVGLGGDIRFFRTVFLEEMNQDYVRTAFAKGASRSRVLFRHVLPNTALPILTRVVIEIPFLLMGSLLLESFFGIPGLGNMMVHAFNQSDWPVIKALTFLGALLFVLGNLVSDLLYAWLDPRVRLN